MLKVLILLIGISFSLPSICFTQNLQYQYSYADEQYANGNVSLALKEYLRTYYFDRTSEFKQLPNEIAKCFVDINDYERAVDFYDLFLNQSSLSKEERFNAQLRKVQILLLDENPSAALIQLLSVADPELVSDSDRLNFLLGFTYLVNGDLDNGFVTINNLSYIDRENFRDLSKYKESLANNLNINHDIPRLMSAVIPGSGQIVNGEYEDAANSILLTGGLLFLLIEVAQELTLIDALVNVGPFYFRYYLGGINNAHKGSIKREKRKTAQTLGGLLKYLKNCKQQKSI